MQQKINPLHCYLRPKDIPEVLEPLEEIPCDKLYINYYPYPFPHRIAREFFLRNKQYTHLILHTNDLVVTLDDYKKMLKNIESYEFVNVISGVCNVDMESEKDYWNICLDLPSLEFPRNYHWVHKDCGLKGSIIRVAFAGFPYMWIRREVLERITLNGEGRPGFDGTDLFGKEGYAADLYFCHSLWNYHVPIFVDTKIEMKHLRFQGKMLVNVKDPFCEFVSKDGKREILFKGVMKGQDFIRHENIISTKS